METYGYAFSSAIYFYLQLSPFVCHSEDPPAGGDEESMTTKHLIIGNFVV